MTNPGTQGVRAATSVCRVNAQNKRSRTGVVGISYTERHGRRASGRVLRFFQVSPHRKQFSIDTLGREEAWRRALKLRSQHEIRVLSERAVNEGALAS